MADDAAEHRCRKGSLTDDAAEHLGTIRGGLFIQLAHRSSRRRARKFPSAATLQRASQMLAVRCNYGSARQCLLRVGQWPQSRERRQRHQSCYHHSKAGQDEHERQKPVRDRGTKAQERSTCSKGQRAARLERRVQAQGGVQWEQLPPRPQPQIQDAARDTVRTYGQELGTCYRCEDRGSAEDHDQNAHVRQCELWGGPVRERRGRGR